MVECVELVCLEPSEPARLAVRPCAAPEPGDDEVVVRVEASSVNPIDVKRAADPKLIEDALSKHPAVAMAVAVGSPDAYAGEVPVAYVQTKPGFSVAEQDLLEFATIHIPERAAIPKWVRIASQLPLTGVGKIFKPASQQQEIENVVRSEAEAAGVAILELMVDRDPQS